MPNTFAYVMIFAWPVLAFIAFRRLPLPAGVAAAMIGGYLLLPMKTEVNLPLLPTFDKPFSAALAGLLLVLALPAPRGATAGGESLLPGWLPRTAALRFCLAGIVGGSLVTVLLNAEPLVYPLKVLPGLSLYDAASAVLGQMMWILPFLIARRVFASPDAQAQFLRVLIVSAALYAFLALFEIRMSPQLHIRIYGFFQHEWIQMVRGDSYRPIVFLKHGLRLALFLSVSYLGALACVRYLAPERRPVFVAVAGLLFVTLLLTKTLGALMIALLFTPFMLTAPARIQLVFVAAITATVLTYPVLRSSGLVPVDRIMSFAESVDPDRARSFGIRIANEEILLDKAKQKPVFGWGGWGRSRVYDENGQDISITDGIWVIQFGVGGWVLYLSTFGLLGLPVLLMVRRRDTLQPDGVSIALTLLLAANMIDLLPNSGLTTITWMLAGALAGRLEWQGAARPGPVAAAAGPKPVFAPGPGTARSYRSPYAPVLRPHAGPPHRKDSPAR